MNGIRDGDLYKIVEICGRRIELRYGFYEEFERNSLYSEPIPIYPDLRREPIYTDDGRPIVTGMQEPCENEECEIKEDPCCAFCRYYDHADELIGICLCEANRKLESSR